MKNLLLWLLDGSCRAILYYFFIQFIESPLLIEFGGISIFISIFIAIGSSLITLLVAKKTKPKIFWGYSFSLVIFITITFLYRYLPVDPFLDENNLAPQTGLFALFCLFTYFIIMFLFRLNFCVCQKFSESKK